MSRKETNAWSDWTDPGTYEVARGVYRIPLPLPNDGLKSVNVYAIIGGNSLAVIDSGWALLEARDALSKALKSISCSLDDVTQFLITHVHRDHYTQAVALRREYGTRISIGRGEEASLSVLTAPRHQPLDAQLSLLRIHGAEDVINLLEVPHRAIIDDMWEMPDEWLVEGQEIALSSRNLKVVNTPGHTRGHVVYVDERERLLFAGDHVLPHITPSIGFETVPSRLPLRNYLESLKVIRELPDMRLLPAHGPVESSTHLRTDEILEHHASRLIDVRATITDSFCTASSSARAMSWTGRAIPFDRLDPFNQMLAILETAAHLDLLVATGQLCARSISGVRYYESNQS